MMTNLDVKCAEAGMKLAQIGGSGERLLNNALGVLQEQGLYACFLYLQAQEKENGKKVGQELYMFLRKEIDPSLEETADSKNGQDKMLAQIAKLAENLDTLLFARELLLQVLTYARYHLKLKSGGGE